VNLEAASTLALDAICQATRDASFVVSIAIVDRYGDLIAARRMEGARPRWMRASIRKAYSSAVMDRDTDHFHDEIVRRDLQIAYYGDAQLTALPGGIVVLDANGETIVGIGVTGKTNGRDAELARAGIAAFTA